MAGAGFKNWNNGDVLYSSDLNTYLGQQTVMVFANATARTAALSGYLAEGMVSYLKDTDTVEVYDGTNWVGFTGDITALSAGTGISLTSATGPIPTVAIDTAVVPRLANANTFTATNTFNAAGTTAVDLIVRATASQTANLQEWQDSASSNLGWITSTGSIQLLSGGTTRPIGWNTGSAARATINTTNNADLTFAVGANSTLMTLSAIGGVAATASIQTATPSANVLIVKGAASQTADLQQWQNSAGTRLSYIDTFGAFYGGGVVTSYQSSFTAGGTTIVPIIVKGVASQTADLQQWQNSSGTVLAKVSSTGRGWFDRVYTNLLQDNSTNGPYIDLSSTRLTILPQNTGHVPLTVKAIASQTANLQEWQNSAGTVLASVNKNGEGFFSIKLSVQGDFGAALNVNPYTASQTGLIIRGYASQTANLQEWQNSSGTVLARVDSTGIVRGDRVLTLNDYAGVREISSGGFLQLYKLNAAGPNIGASFGAIYLRDGTNAGTLKLVIRAGAAGAETTILDNIPQ